MTTLAVPALEENPWSSLGRQVCSFIETYLIHGPGDLRGQPARLDAEKRALVYRMYEVYPADHPHASGRRRFRRVALSLRKGTAKTELAAWIAAVELHAEGPVRCDGWDADGEPVGAPVTDPYIPMVAYTEEQSEDLVYGALYTILSEGPLASDFDIGIARIMRVRGDGKAVALATAPDARDGARTTFQSFDETHRFTLPRLKAAHRTMLANLPKRRLADPWCLETTTAPSPGEGSVAEDTMTYARSVAAGETDDARLFFFHRQASDAHDLTQPEGLRAAVMEASGPAASWSDIDGICEQWDDPTADRAYLERVWLNRPVQASSQAFDALRWRELANPHEIPDGELITLGFDGARYHDATALVASHVESGYQWLVGLWQPPAKVEGWEVPYTQVDATVTEAFRRWNVWRMYADLWAWDSWIAQWQGRWGEKRVIGWDTRRIRQMAHALSTYRDAMTSGDISHDGDPTFAEHIGNACKQLTNFTDEDGNKLWLIHKERPDSPFKIDAAMAGALANEARNDAIASGAAATKRSVYEDRGLLTLG